MKHETRIVLPDSRIRKTEVQIRHVGLNKVFLAEAILCDLKESPIVLNRNNNIHVNIPQDKAIVPDCAEQISRSEHVYEAVFLSYSIPLYQQTQLESPKLFAFSSNRKPTPDFFFKKGFRKFKIKINHLSPLWINNN